MKIRISLIFTLLLSFSVLGQNGSGRESMIEVHEMLLEACELKVVKIESVMAAIANAENNSRNNRADLAHQIQDALGGFNHVTVGISEQTTPVNTQALQGTSDQLTQNFENNDQVTVQSEITRTKKTNEEILAEQKLHCEELRGDIASLRMIQAYFDEQKESKEKIVEEQRVESKDILGDNHFSAGSDSTKSSNGTAVKEDYVCEDGTCSAP